MMDKASACTKVQGAVCLFLSALMLLMSLLCHAALMSSEQRVVSFERELLEQNAENRILKLKMESRISLGELDRLATEKLGMQRPSTEQLFYGMTAAEAISK